MFYKSEIVPLSHIMAFPHCRQDEVPLPQHELQGSSRVWLLRSSHTSNLVPSTPKHSVPWPHNGSLHSPPKSLSHCTHRVERVIRAGDSDRSWSPPALLNVVSRTTQTPCPVKTTPKQAPSLNVEGHALGLPEYLPWPPFPLACLVIY